MTTGRINQVTPCYRCSVPWQHCCCTLTEPSNRFSNSAGTEVAQQKRTPARAFELLLSTTWAHAHYTFATPWDYTNASTVQRHSNNAVAVGCEFGQVFTSTLLNTHFSPGWLGSFDTTSLLCFMNHPTTPYVL